MINSRRKGFQQTQGNSPGILKKVQEAIRVVGVPTKDDLDAVEDLGHALAAGVDFGIF